MSALKSYCLRLPNPTIPTSSYFRVEIVIVRAADEALGAPNLGTLVMGTDSRPRLTNLTSFFIIYSHGGRAFPRAAFERGAKIAVSDEYL